MRFFNRILWRIFGERLWVIQDLKEKQMREWLFRNYGDAGMRTYLVLRQRTIEAQMGLGLSEKENWEMVGRIKEIKILGRRVEEEKKRREKVKKKV